MAILQGRVKTHDQRQLEIKYFYALASGNPKPWHTVELFIFVPQSLDVNRDNYSRDHFYRDIQSRIRWKTPQLRLASLADKKNPPLQNLQRSMKSLAHSPNSPAKQAFFTRTIKLFCAAAKSALRDKTESLRRQDDNSQAIQKFEHATVELLNNFRELRQIFENAHLNGEFLTLYDFADEYISLLAEYYFAGLALAMKKQSKTSNKLYGTLLKLAESETRYRRQRRFASVIKENSRNESAIYQMRSLKKLMSSVLYLNTSRTTSGKFFFEFLASLAAGMAMLIALILSLFGQRLFVGATGWLVILAVLCYIMRDKIKDSWKLKFVDWAKRYFYDYKTKITNEAGIQVGVSRELFRYADESMLPPEIRELRSQNSIAKLAHLPGEHVFYYKNRIELDPQAIKNTDFNGIVEVLRMNISTFLSRMDAPSHPLMLPRKNEIKSIDGHCIYHINLIFRYQSSNKNPQYQRFRLILDRDGITKIEQVK